MNLHKPILQAGEQVPVLCSYMEREEGAALGFAAKPSVLCDGPVQQWYI